MAARHGAIAPQINHGETTLHEVYIPTGCWEATLETAALGDFELRARTAKQGGAGRGSIQIISSGAPQIFRVVGTRGLVYGISLH